jgi:glycerate-2-kinase
MVIELSRNDRYKKLKYIDLIEGCSVVIKNLAKLIKNGCGQRNREARTLLLEACQETISKINPTKLLKEQVRLKGNELLIQNRKFDLENFASIYVIGAGKAGKAMAEAINKTLGNKIKMGLVNHPGKKTKTGAINLNSASHPIPDFQGLAGSKAILQLAKNAGKNDLVICLISGGGSSLMPLPANGISLQDKIDTTKLLLESGADITEINCVRKHISAIKGGRLARVAYPATLVNLVLSDVIADPLDCIASGPASPDPTTFAGSIEILKKYDLLKKVSPAIKTLLAEGADKKLKDTPDKKDSCFKNTFNFVIGNNKKAIDCVVDYFKRKNIEVFKIKQFSKIDAGKAAREFSKAALKLKQGVSRPKHPVAIVSGGETNAVVKGAGLGGRVQEMALASVEFLKNRDGITLCYFATDGIDGPTDAAGAIVDGETSVHAMLNGLNTETFLKNNDSYHYFKNLGELIFTGYTGTNLNDIYLALIF